MTIVTKLTNAFPAWVIGTSCLAVVWPETVTWFNGPLITLGLAVIMLSMGMTIGFVDFKRISSERRIVIPGIALQYTLMPVLGWSLAILFDLPTPLATGLILVSCCPGGTASNVISFLARADVALSVTMTTVSTILAVFMTPILTTILAGRRVDVPTTDLLLDTFQVVIIPVIAGVFIKWKFPRVSNAVQPFAPLVAVLAISLIVGSVIGSSQQELVNAGFRLILALIFLHIGGFILGYFFGRLILGRELFARTVAIEVGMQNSGLGVVLAQQNFANPLVALPCAISALFHSIIGSIAAALWRIDANKYRS